MADLKTSLAIFGAGVGFASSATALIPSITETIAAKVLPAGQPQKVYQTLMLMYAIIGSSTETATIHWKSYVVSYTFAAFPSLATVPEVVETCTLETFTPAQCQMLVDLDALLRSDATDAAIAVALRRTCAMVASSIAVAINPPHVAGIVESMGLRAAFAHFSLVVYLSAKLITDANRTQMTEARPRAVISAFLLYDSSSTLPEGIVSTLNGDMMLSPAAHHGIHRAWFEMSAFRKFALAPILVSATHGRQIAFEVMHVTVSMMKWAQMSHAIFIAQLLAAEPWIETYAPLAAQVQLFKTSAEKLRELPAAEVEFTRVIHGNRVGLFRRRDLAGLVECALADLRASTPTVGAYFSDPSYAPTVLAYQTEKARQHALRAATGAAAPIAPIAAPVSAPAPPPVVAPVAAPVTTPALVARTSAPAPAADPAPIAPGQQASADLLQLESSTGGLGALAPDAPVAGPAAAKTPTPAPGATRQPKRQTKKERGKGRQSRDEAQQERLALLEAENRALREAHQESEEDDEENPPFEFGVPQGIA